MSNRACEHEGMFESTYVWIGGGDNETGMGGGYFDDL